MFGQGSPHSRSTWLPAKLVTHRFGQPVERRRVRAPDAKHAVRDRTRFGLSTIVFFALIVCGYLVARGQDAIPLGGPTFAIPTTQPAPAYVTPKTNAFELPSGDAQDWSVQFRIAWGGGPEKPWRGEFTWSAGPGRPIRALGIEADEPGSISVENGTVIVAARSPRGYDGLDVRFPYDPTAKLKYRLKSEDGTLVEGEVSIDELLKPSWQRNLDDRGNRLFIRRMPADQLRIDPKRDALIFAPREAWSFTVTPHLLPVASDEPLKIRAKLTAKNGGREILAQEFVIERWTPEWSRPKDNAATQSSIPFQFAMPDAEGVYDLTLEAIERGTLRWGKTVLTRNVQVVVVADLTPRTIEQPIPWTKTYELDPTNVGWAEKFRQSWNLSAAPLGNGRSSTTNIAELGPCVRLADAEPPTDPAWEAYPLTVAKPGQPQLLEIEYPTHLAQQLGISIVEPNAAGQVQAVGLDSGVGVSPLPGTSPGWSRHRLAFWPRTKAPFVLLTNRAATGPAYFGKIRVLSGPAHLPPTEVARGFDPNERVWGAAWLRPLFPEQFGAQEAVDPWSGRGLDDWQTFYEGSTRLLEYARYAGQNMVVVSALADGSAIYPSRVLDPTPRYDTGVFFDHGGDPLRKDVLELLARMCDRDGQRLLVGMQFSAPLPELETLLKSDPQAVGIELEGIEGKPYHAVHPPHRGLAPYYNPLDERVQDAIARVVREVATRYAQHPSFSGLALELDGDSYLQFPGEFWGLDDRTFARFVAMNRLSIAAEGPSRHWLRAKYLTENPDVKELWLRWRANQLREFHLRLQRELHAARADARLVMSPTRPWDTPEALEDALPRWNGANTARAARGKLGWEYDERPQVGELAWMRPWPQQSGGNWGSWSVAGGETGRDWDDWSRRGPLATSLFYHEPRRLRLPSFDAKSPFGKDKTSIWQLSQFAPSGIENRRRLAVALARTDNLWMIDAGHLPGMGQEESLVEFTAAYRRLPPHRFQTIAGETEPVVLRTLIRDGQTWFYAVNTAPWKTTVELKLDTTIAVRPIELSGFRTVPAPLDRTWKLELGPYDLIAVRFPGEIRFSAPTIGYPSELRNELERRIALLHERRTRLENPAALVGAANSDWERADASGKPSGWTIQAARPESAKLTLDAREPHGGTRSGKIAIDDSNGIVLRSERFETPRTGRAALSVWLRIDDPGKQPAVRLAVEGYRHESGFYRFALIGAGQNAAPLRRQWSQYVLQIDDLPLDDLTDLRVRIDVAGKGELFIDDVQLFDLTFSEQERRQLDKTLALADFQLRQGQLGRCWADLQGDWARFLAELVPAASPAENATVDRTPNTTIPPRVPEKQAEKPGVMDRMRNLWR